MVKPYKRTSNRASWTEGALESAMKEVLEKRMGINEASRAYGIPSRTLRRHLKTGSSKVQLGCKTDLGTQHEQRLVLHVKALEKVGFAPNRRDVMILAYKFAERLGLPHRFSRKKESAGYDWFDGFLSRNKVLSIRKSEGLSIARAHGVNRKDIGEYFSVLYKLLTENDLLDKPGRLYNMDETGIQVNNKPELVLASKGAKDVYSLTSSEKGENVTVIACCNAEGSFMPPTLIMKGTYKKPDFVEGLPPGSDVYMNPKSSYINAELFIKWFKEVFLVKKTEGKVLLILDGHGSHCNSVELLDLAVTNDVILLCLPSHTTHVLQPLDRAFFKPLKSYFASEAKTWIINHKDRKLSRHHVSTLIGTASGRSATVENGVAAMKCTGIYPFNPSAIPEHFFSISDSIINDDSSTVINQILSNADVNQMAPSCSSGLLPSPSMPPTSSATSANDVSRSSNSQKETPSKYLSAAHPIPEIPSNKSTRKQSTTVLTSPEHRIKRQILAEKKKTKDRKIEDKMLIGTEKKKRENVCLATKRQKENLAPAKKNKRRRISISSTDDEDEEIILPVSSEDISDEDNDRCAECYEDYYRTKSKEDWIGMVARIMHHVFAFV